MKTWDKFDKIYCVHYLPQTKRYLNIAKQLSKVGLLGNPKFSWKLTFDSPFYGQLQKSVKLNPLSKLASNFKKGYVLKCALAHY